MDGATKRPISLADLFASVSNETDNTTSTPVKETPKTSRRKATATAGPKSPNSTLQTNAPVKLLTRQGSVPIPAMVSSIPNANGNQTGDLTKQASVRKSRRRKSLPNEAPPPQQQGSTPALDTQKETPKKTAATPKKAASENGKKQQESKQPQSAKKKSQSPSRSNSVQQSNNANASPFIAQATTPVSLKEQHYAGATFQNSPAPSDLPMPVFLRARRSSLSSSIPAPPSSTSTLSHVSSSTPQTVQSAPQTIIGFSAPATGVWSTPTPLWPGTSIVTTSKKHHASPLLSPTQFLAQRPPNMDLTPDDDLGTMSSPLQRGHDPGGGAVARAVAQLASTVQGLNMPRHAT